ncbi:MAG: carboxyl-terminal processing protease [Candidatus Eremiobacteraeota bacterium]|nr:carboxyl-terminal processing protease [Candidatus Eremiobacteraeota bacterium]
MLGAAPCTGAAAPQRRPAPARAAAPASLGALDVIALEICYTTIMARYYKPVEPAELLAGARGAIVAYLVSRGVPHPNVPPASAHADRYRAESEIDRDVALAVARYGSRVRTADLVSKTIAGELAALHDPYTVLFPPAEFKKFVGFLDGKPAAGIGAELDVDPQTHAVRVVDVFPGSPAEGAGLQPGDAITSIDGNAPPATTPDAVSKALRGTPGSTVRIGFTRDGVAHDSVAIVRKVVSAPNVTGRVVQNAIGYVRIRSFGAQSPQQLDAVLAKLRAANVRAYALDLRANGGGYRDAAVAIGSRFVRGTIVTTQERAGKPVAFTAKAGVSQLDAPLAVLVDGDTASAAEIVAGAIQDDKAGTLVGARTFGKGLVQETFALPDGGAIKMTTARYLTPAGRDIDKVGITPDVVVAQSADAHPGEPGRDPQLDRALALLPAR